MFSLGEVNNAVNIHVRFQSIRIVRSLLMNECTVTIGVRLLHNLITTLQYAVG
jgi:hypothetical protein